jgi:hypothetical protein
MMVRLVYGAGKLVPIHAAGEVPVTLLLSCVAFLFTMPPWHGRLAPWTLMGRPALSEANGMPMPPLRVVRAFQSHNTSGARGRVSQSSEGVERRLPFIQPRAHPAPRAP